MNYNAIQDAKGDTSSMRVIMLSWVFLLLIGTVYLTILDGKFPNIPVGLQVITTAILASKLWQNGQENKLDTKVYDLEKDG
ncbi:MAG: hypothetical protein WAW75_07925 [Gallionella sp.]